MANRLVVPNARPTRVGALLASLGALVGAAAGVVATAPTAHASGNTGPISYNYDLRASEQDSNGAFQIAIGQPATFTAWVNNNGQTAESQAVTFGSIVLWLKANMYGPDSTPQIYLRLSYGWSPQCQTLGPGDPPTDDGCETERSGSYTSISPATTWGVPTKEPAPSGTETLYYDFQLFGQSSPGAPPDLLLQAAAGAIVLSTAPSTVAIDAENPTTGSPYPANVISIPSGTAIDVQTCVTTDNCQIGTLDESNFLSDDEYICGEPQGSYTDANGNPVKPIWYGGSADQVLTLPDVSESPPQGENWEFKFYGFVSQDTGFLTKPPPCPPPSGDYMTSNNGQPFIDPLPVLEVEWTGPVFTPPSVALTYAPTNPSPGQQVTLTASYDHPDGAGYLYICARSGTSWLQFSGSQASPYVAQSDLGPPVPQSGTVSASIGPQSGQAGTAQFIAFLSSTPPGNFRTCPDASTPGTYGTRYAGDFSNYVNVSWYSPPQVSLSGRCYSASNPPPSTAPDLNCGGNVTAQLYGTATGLTGLPAGYGYYEFICTPTTPLPGYYSPGSGGGPPPPYLDFDTGASPYADTGTPLTPPGGSDYGAVSGNNTSATFLAFVSTDPNYPTDSGGSCPTAATGTPTSPADVLAVSNEVTVSWSQAPPGSGQWYPD
jgi:hypothetical protein